MTPRPPAPRLSVIVPARDAAPTLERCLDALRASTLPREDWELIVVDDASEDGTSSIAATRADAVVRLPGAPHGPAYARNRGVEASRGEIVVFVDATVAVVPGALERLQATFDADPELSAATGCWDAHARRRGLTDRYRDAWRTFEQTRWPAPTFWAGLGALRASVFAEVGPFDEWLYPTSSVEDAELGHRLRLAGRRVVRVAEARATCLEPARLRSVLVDDVRKRVMPGTRLALHVGQDAAEPRHRRAFLSGACALVALVALAAWPFRAELGAGWLAGAALLGLIGADGDMLGFASRMNGALVTALTIPLHIGAAAARAIGAFLGWSAHHLVGPPRVPIEIYARKSGDEAPMWPPRPVQPTLSVWTRPPHRAVRRSGQEAA